MTTRLVALLQRLNNEQTQKDRTMPRTRRRYHPINVTITSPDGRVERNRYSIGSDPAFADAHMVLWLVRLSTSWGADRVAQYVCGVGMDLPAHIPIGEVGPIVARLDR